MVDCAEEEDLGFGGHWCGLKRSRIQNQRVERYRSITKEIWTGWSDEEIKNVCELWEM